MIQKDLTVVVVAMLVVSVVSQESALVVNTEEGRVEGTIHETLNGRPFFAFYGVPYARPPLGDYRFKAPLPPVRWMRVWRSTKPPQPCLQVPFGSVMAGIKVPPEELTGSEDCLYVNVFTPTLEKKTSKGGKLPVMVWFHGVGFFSGGAHQYPPHAFMEHDVVLVVVQYRLGILGFLSTEDSVMPGNLGLRDQHLALQWVQNNIYYFGGDKDRVTIFGESTGATSVHLHMFSPHSRGLFSRVILQSGTALLHQLSTFKHKQLAQEVASAVGCPPDLHSHDLQACLQKADARNLTAQIQNTFKWFMFPMTVAPRVDGDFLPDEPAEMVRDGRYHKVDLMSGVTTHEGSLLVLAMDALPHLRTELETNFDVVGPISLEMWEEEGDPVSLSKLLYRYYLGDLNFDNTRNNQLIKLFSDVHFNMGHDLVTFFHAKHAKDKATFRYEFAHRGSFSFADLYNTEVENKWVPHCDDLLYLFPGVPFQDAPQMPTNLTTPEDQRLRDIMTSLWTNFAATGHPTADASLGFTWEAATPDSLHYLSLTANPAMHQDNRKKVREYHTSLPLYRYRILFPDHFKGGTAMHHDQEEL